MYVIMSVVGTVLSGGGLIDTRDNNNTYVPLKLPIQINRCAQVYRSTRPLILLLILRSRLLYLNSVYNPEVIFGQIHSTKQRCRDPIGKILHTKNILEIRFQRAQFALLLLFL